jgi:DNA-binding CsgD family transcriptional regulator
VSATAAAKFDPVEVLERGYTHHGDKRSWRRALVPLIVNGIDPEQTGGVDYLITNTGPVDVHWTPGINVQITAEIAEASVVEAFSTSSAESRRRLFASIRFPGLHSMVEALGLLPESAVARVMPEMDSPVVVIQTGEGPPMLVGTVTKGRYRIDSAERMLWRKISSHLGAGYRLSDREASAEASDVECVLTPGGKVMHAVGPGTARAAQERIRAAIADIDRARTRRGRADPHAALELWRGLFLGRWSLVDHFDSDGRRFLLARHNDPHVRGAKTIPLRQRQILFYVSAGWSNKEVGYALGISESTVATHLRRALSSLGVASRSDWVRVAASIGAGADAHIDSTHHAFPRQTDKP